MPERPQPGSMPLPWGMLTIAGMALAAYATAGRRGRDRVTALELELSAAGKAQLLAASRPARLSFDRAAHWVRLQSGRDQRLRLDGRSLHWKPVARHPDGSVRIELHEDAVWSHVVKMPRPLEAPDALVERLAAELPEDAISSWSPLVGHR